VKRPLMPIPLLAASMTGDLVEVQLIAKVK
jgi:hypothetical protein